MDTNPTSQVDVILPEDNASHHEEQTHSFKKKFIVLGILLLLLIGITIKGYPYIMNQSNTQTPPNPSHTPTPSTVKLKEGDLSYITIYTDPNVVLVLKNASGKEVSQSFVETISDPTGESKHIISSREIYYAKPDTGVYFAEFSSTSSAIVSYKAEILLYDTEGNDVLSSHSGVLKNGKDVVKINFNKLDSKASFIQK